ncbi:hypothetical protein [Nocardia sp. NPDC060249]|uniref:hypothetical protein n=1 Tax=Nocardia sp. NPDC060249 TaxID=3347082 RepID=UPI0036487E09
MRFRLKLLWFELEIDTPEPVQVSSTDLIAALWSAIAQNPVQQYMLVSEDDPEE